LAYKKLKSMNGEFSIIHVSSEVMEVFKLTGFDQNFDIQTK
jgi:anti-anti-sigma regulatory factor